MDKGYKIPLIVAIVGIVIVLIVVVIYQMTKSNAGVTTEASRYALLGGMTGYKDYDMSVIGNHDITGVANSYYQAMIAGAGSDDDDDSDDDSGDDE